MNLLGIWVGCWCCNAIALSAPGPDPKGYKPKDQQSKGKCTMAVSVPEDGLSIPPCRDFLIRERACFSLLASP